METILLLDQNWKLVYWPFSKETSIYHVHDDGLGWAPCRHRKDQRCRVCGAPVPEPFLALKAFYDL